MAGHLVKIFFVVLAVSAGVAGVFALHDFGVLYSATLKHAIDASMSAGEVVFTKFANRDIGREVTLLFVGDIMLDRGVFSAINKHSDWTFPFSRSGETLREADITIGNLEGPISDRGTRSGSIYSFRFDPRVAPVLADAGFDVLSLANNHIFDYGMEALIDTHMHLARAGIASTGAGANAVEANAPAVLEVGGQKFAFFSYTTLYPKALQASNARVGISELATELITEQITEQKGNGAFVVALLHWGDEYAEKPNKEQRAFAESLANSGADLIVGHHPHVVQPVEKVGNAWTVWSLGNFIFDQSFSEETMRGLGLAVTVHDGKTNKVLTVPVVINEEFQPEFQLLELREL